MAKILRCLVVTCLLALLIGGGGVAAAQPAAEYPASIAKLPTDKQAEFIRSARDHGWYQHRIIDVNPGGLLVIDGLGNLFSIPWSAFFRQTAGELGWDNGKIGDFFRISGISAQGDYPDSVRDLPIEQRVAFGLFVQQRGWYEQQIAAVDTADRTATIVDGLGNAFRLPLEEFYRHTAEAHHWTNEELRAWWQWNGELMMAMGSPLLLALLVAGLVLVGVVLVRS